jgi:hypothetical protein
MLQRKIQGRPSSSWSGIFIGFDTSQYRNEIRCLRKETFLRDCQPAVAVVGHDDGHEITVLSIPTSYVFFGFLYVVGPGTARV